MRLEITRRSDLAVRALCSLASGDKTKGADLAERIGTSQAFVAQVMGPLVQAGWVQSDPGPTGGYSLVSELNSISMLDLIETMEGPSIDGTCVLRGGPCPADENCALHDAWLPARDALLQRLSEATIASAAGCISAQP